MASGERCSRGRAPRQKSAPKTTGGTKSGQQISSREEIPSREVGVSDHARNRRRLERWVRTSCRRRL
jgi:hypothetical protein